MPGSTLSWASRKNPGTSVLHDSFATWLLLSVWCITEKRELDFIFMKYRDKTLNATMNSSTFTDTRSSLEGSYKG